MVLVTRGDLIPGYQSVQPAHAISAFAMKFPTTFRRWYNNYHNIAVLAAPNEKYLLDLFERAEGARLKCVLFKEPDIGNEATAIAIEPHELTYKMTSCLPLALRDYAEVDVVRKDLVKGG